MDKNTLNGLICMLLVFLVFMWLQPKNENKENLKDQTTEQGTPVSLSVDSLSATEKGWLISNIKENGVPQTLSDSTRAYQLVQGPLNLTLIGDSIFGTVEVNGDKLAWGDITGKSGKLSVDAKHKALEAIRVAMAFANVFRSVCLSRY